MTKQDSYNKRQLVLNHLISGKSITGQEALRLYGLYRLSSAINVLRKNYDIVTEMIEEDGLRYASYRMAEMELDVINKMELDVEKLDQLHKS